MVSILRHTRIERVPERSVCHEERKELGHSGDRTQKPAEGLAISKEPKYGEHTEAEPSLSVSRSALSSQKGALYQTRRR